MTEEVSEETKQVIERVEKLLRLAAKNPNQAEAASATAKAQELLSAYNLDMAAVAENGESDGRRAKEALDGGRYQWEKDLWRYVATLNFCIHWNQLVFTPTPLGSKERWHKDRWVKGVEKWQHNVVGRKVNVMATKHMATYLQDVSKRLTKEACKEHRVPARSAWANSFMQGVVDEICLKIFDRRADRINEEAQAQYEARKAATETARSSGASASTAITLASYTASEHDANIDFIHGEGTSAKWAADRAKRAAAAAAADEEYTRWAAANPKAAAREEAKRKRDEDRRAKRDARKFEFKGNWGAYSAGLDAGRNVSIDPQTEGRKQSAGLLK